MRQPQTCSEEDWTTWRSSFFGHAVNGDGPNDAHRTSFSSAVFIFQFRSACAFPDTPQARLSGWWAEHPHFEHAHSAQHREILSVPQPHFCHVSFFSVKNFSTRMESSFFRRALDKQGARRPAHIANMLAADKNVPCANVHTTKNILLPASQSYTCLDFDCIHFITKRKGRKESHCGHVGFASTSRCSPAEAFFWWVSTNHGEKAKQKQHAWCGARGRPYDERKPNPLLTLQFGDAASVTKEFSQLTVHLMGTLTT